MNNRHEELLRQVCEETLAALAFLSPVSEEECPAADLDSPWVAVEFTGPFRGSLTLCVSERIPAILAANVLGLDDGEQPSLEQQADALKETLNVICGNLLPLVSDAVQVFNVQAPRLMEGKEPQSLPPADSSVLLFTDAGRARVSLSLKDAAA
jgi:CheY-specific phosphatase CheX